MTNDSFAIIYTVKNEWETLRYSIPYYITQGSSRIFLFLDGTTDNSREETLTLDNVETRECASLEELPCIPDWVKALDPAHHMDHRKRINVLIAAEKARNMGIKWICSIDPDEMVIPNEGQTSIGAMLGAVPLSVDQVLVPNLELLPMMTDDDNFFASQKLFLNRQDNVANIWRATNFILRRLMSPRQCSKIENTFYRLTNRGLFPPVLINPLTGTKIYRSLFLGYNNHKSFIRSDIAQNYNFNIHKWQKINKQIRSIKKGRLLHYDLPTFKYYQKKFRQRDANMQIKAFDTRLQISQIARDAPTEIAQVFYNEWLCCSDNIAQQLVHAGIATWVEEVANFFSTTK